MVYWKDGVTVYVEYWKDGVTVSVVYWKDGVYVSVEYWKYRVQLVIMTSSSGSVLQFLMVAWNLVSL